MPSPLSSLTSSANVVPVAGQIPSTRSSQLTTSEDVASGPLSGPSSEEGAVSFSSSKFPSGQENKSPLMSSYSDIMSPPRSTYPAPPLPPRIYANISSDDNTEQTLINKPLPPLPGNPTPRLASAKSRSMPPATSDSFAQLAVEHVKRESSTTTVERTPSFKCYDCDPPELGTNSYSSKCTHHSPRKASSSRSGQTKVKSKEHKTKTADGAQPHEQKHQTTLPTGVHPYFTKLQAGREQRKSTDSRTEGHEPFDWLTGAVADFTFGNNNSSSHYRDKGSTTNNFNTRTDKRNSRWENKNIAGAAPPKQSHEKYQESLDPSSGARAKTTSPPSRDLYGQVGDLI